MTGVATGVAMVAAAGLAVVWLVGEKVLDRWAGLRDTTIGVEQLQDKIRTWERDYRIRRRAVYHRMTIVEHAVAQAEDRAHHAADDMRQLRAELLRRMEHVEPRIELEVLVAQVRIPSEHLPN